MRAADFQVSLDELHKVYPALARALAESGEAPPRIAELVGSHLGIRCVGCRQQISGEDLAELALNHDPKGAPAGSPIQQRLRLGYCAKPDCNSRYYALTADTGMVAWPQIFNRARHFMDHPVVVLPPAKEGVTPAETGAGGNSAAASPGDPAVEEVEDRPPMTFQERWRRAKFAGLGAVAALGLIVWWWQSGARVPGLSPKARSFEVLPTPGQESIPPVAPAGGGSTNAPRAFRVVQ